MDCHLRYETRKRPYDNLLRNVDIFKRHMSKLVCTFYCTSRGLNKYKTSTFNMSYHFATGIPILCTFSLDVHSPLVRRSL